MKKTFKKQFGAKFSLLKLLLILDIFLEKNMYSTKTQRKNVVR